MNIQEITTRLGLVVLLTLQFSCSSTTTPIGNKAYYNEDGVYYGEGGPYYGEPGAYFDEDEAYLGEGGPSYGYGGYDGYGYDGYGPYY